MNTWGPVSLVFYTILILVAGYGLSWLVAWFAWRRHASSVKRREDILAAIAETKRLLAKDPQRVGKFIDEFGRDLLEHFGPLPAITQMTMHDLRNHVEVAVFNLLVGCPCGNCPGVSIGGGFCIEARHDWSGLILRGVVSKPMSEVGLRVDVARPKVVAPHNVTMVCSVCKETPVVTSIDHISEGKQPTCAGCLAKAKKVPGA